VSSYGGYQCLTLEYRIRHKPTPAGRRRGPGSHGALLGRSENIGLTLFEPGALVPEKPFRAPPHRILSRPCSGQGSCVAPEEGDDEGDLRWLAFDLTPSATRLVSRWDMNGTSSACPNLPATSPPTPSPATADPSRSCERSRRRPDRGDRPASRATRSARRDSDGLAAAQALGSTPRIACSEARARPKRVRSDQHPSGRAVPARLDWLGPDEDTTAACHTNHSRRRARRRSGSGDSGCGGWMCWRPSSALAASYLLAVASA
jgi:hypothetical protein